MLSDRDINFFMFGLLFGIPLDRITTVILFILWIIFRNEPLPYFLGKKRPQELGGIFFNIFIEMFSMIGRRRGRKLPEINEGRNITEEMLKEKLEQLVDPTILANSEEPDGSTDSSEVPTDPLNSRGQLVTYQGHNSTVGIYPQLTGNSDIVVLPPNFSIGTNMGYQMLNTNPSQVAQFGGGGGSLHLIPVNGPITGNFSLPRKGRRKGNQIHL